LVLASNVVHRLDRLASGILILPRTKELADLYLSDIYHHRVVKIYLSLVRGRFPETLLENHRPLTLLCPRLGISCTTSSGKESVTKFIRLNFDASKNESLVLCRPITGRSHQIRVHLLDLGFPIKNDPLYDDACWLPWKLNPSEGNKANIIKTLHQKIYNFEFIEPLPLTIFQRHSEFKDNFCLHCREPQKVYFNESQFIYLHAYSYSGLAWAYKSALPGWAAGVSEGALKEAVRLLLDENNS
jgi:23S rRNA-/tRNA-specific pseudouridylate synthase